MATILAWLLCALAIGGIGCTLYQIVLVRRWSRRSPPSGPAEPVSLMKPLHGAEPRLAENLASFLGQDWPAPIQMVAGVQRVDDPAIEVVKKLGAPAQAGAQERAVSDWAPACAGAQSRSVDVVIDPTSHGANAKVANLVNMAPAARHDLLVLSDSDMAVPAHYLRVLAGALGEPGVGAVTCLYRGRGDAGGWSRLAAAASSYHFLPAVLLGLAIGNARPCMGSTIAIRRGTLAAIGGFEAFADRIADDYDLGRAVNALGLNVAIPPMLLVHATPETSLTALWRHELRWAVTLRAIDPAGNAGMVFTYPLPFALALVPLMPRLGSALAVATLVARLLLKRVVDAWAGASTCPFWMLPPRDCLGLAVFFAGLVARSVDWRGSRLRMESKGRVAIHPESLTL